MSSSLSSWRDRIGVVDQETYLFNASVLQNIRFGRLGRPTTKRLSRPPPSPMRTSSFAGLPQGYDTEIGDRGHRLSGGQRQRIAIARAVLRDPDILIFDEATSALDSHSERLIQQSLHDLRQDRTLVVIAHRLSTITDADHIVVLDDSRIVEQGSHRDLLAANGAYAALWQLQAVTEERQPDGVREKASSK